MGRMVAPNPCWEGVKVREWGGASPCTGTPAVCLQGQRWQSTAHWATNAGSYPPTVWGPKVQNQGVGRAVFH